MTSASPKIKQTIIALLAKARGTDNEHEAEAFLAKAMDMMQQYQLDVADMVDAGDPILQHIGLDGAVGGHAWRWKLYSSVARLYGCRVVHATSYRDYKGKPTRWYEVRLVGRESATITTDLMYPWIAEQVRKSAKALAAISGMSEQGQAKRVAAALIVRINKLVIAQEAAAPTTAAGRNALLVLDQVSAKYDELYPGIKKTNSRRMVTDALARQAAEDIGLHRQAGRTTQLKLDKKP